ncbi:hypothetical protein LTS18_009011, partial [Coniosporium uncinatum]
MRVLANLFLVAAAAALSTARSEKRELRSSFSGREEASLKPVVDKNLEPGLRKSATRKQLRWGPVKVYSAEDPNKPKSFGLDPNSVTFENTIEGIHTDVAVLWGKLNLLYEDGERADINTGMYNHHALISDTVKKASMTNFCGDKVAAGSAHGEHGLAKRQYPGRTQFLASGND